MFDEKVAIGNVSQADVCNAVSVKIADERLIVGAGRPGVNNLVVKTGTVLDEEVAVTYVAQANICNAVSVKIADERLIVESPAAQV